MSEEPTTPETPVDPEPRPAEPTAAQGESEVLDELSRLGNAIVEALQAAWASDERKKLEKDLSTGLRSLADSVEEALEKVGKNEQVHEVLDKAEDVAESVGEKVRESKVTADLAEGLSKGLSAVTAQLNKLAGDMQARSQEPPAPPTADAADDEGQDIPIQKA